jgi:hypothetical protein
MYGHSHLGWDGVQGGNPLAGGTVPTPLSIFNILIVLEADVLRAIQEVEDSNNEKQA